MSEDTGLGPDLVRWGRAARILTTGRRTGRHFPVIVSFHQEEDGSLLVASGEPDSGWTRNLVANPAAIVTIGERSFPVVAEQLSGADFVTAIRELILKGGTPAERLGRGPAFRLRPVVPQDIPPV